MDLGATVFSTGWASGVNSYATVLVLCLLGRAGVGEVPEGFDQNWVLYAAAGMFAIEFVTDKVPFLDSAWDSFHTVVRPLIGVVLGFSFAGEHGVDGILVSNHGGRSTETRRSTIQALPEVVAAVGGRVPVFVDGGDVAGIEGGLHGLQLPLHRLHVVLAFSDRSIGLRGRHGPSPSRQDDAQQQRRDTHVLLVSDSEIPWRAYRGIGGAAAAARINFVPLSCPPGEAAL